MDRGLFAGDLDLILTEIHGGIWVGHSSHARLLGVQHGTGTEDDVIGVWRGSYLMIRDSVDDVGDPVPSQFNISFNLHSHSGVDINTSGMIYGSMWLDRFSEVVATTVDPIQGQITCGIRSRAFCDPHPAGGVDGCE